MAYHIEFQPANDRPFEADVTFETWGDAANAVMDYVSERHEEYPEDCPKLDLRRWSFPDADTAIYKDTAGNAWTITYLAQEG